MKSAGDIMIDRITRRDAATRLLEHRWYAAMKAARALQIECEVLREVVNSAEDAWRRARVELAHLEAIRDALDEELADREECATVQTVVRA